jgi:hypothetical protein
MSSTYERVWNQYDEMGLLVGIPRIPGEGNATYRYRLLNHSQFDSTKQGLSDYISSSLLQREVNVTERLVFTSLRVPLSYFIYKTIGSTDSYISPSIIIGANTWTIEASDDDQKDVSNIINGVYWSLWKQPDGSYDQIWTTNVAPIGNMELKYQWRESDSTNLYLIRELPTLMTWNNGVIEEANPDD